MKYMFLNLRRLFESQKLVMTVFTLCILVTVNMVLFAYGMFQNMRQELLEETYGEDCIELGFDETQADAVTVGEAKAYLLSMEDSIQGKCFAVVAARLREDQQYTETGAKTLSRIITMSEVENGSFTAGDMMQEYYRDSLKDGSFFTAEQIENGEMVCLTMPEKIREASRGNGLNEIIDKYTPDADGICVLDGKSYQSIGHMDLGTVAPIVPITTLDEDIPVDVINLIFPDRIVTKTDYMELRETAKAVFGEKVEVPELQVEDRDNISYYIAILAASICMIVMAGLVLVMLFKYLVMSDRKNMVITRLCGLTASGAAGIYLAEYVFLIAVSGLAGMVIYRTGLLWLLAERYPKLMSYCGWGTCSLLVAAYLLIVSLMEAASLSGYMKTSVMNLLRGGR